MDGAGHCRLHGIGPVARSYPEARSQTSLHCRLVRRGSASAAHAHSAFFFFRVPTLFSTGHFPSLLAARCAASAYQHARTRGLRHACARARTHAGASTRAHGQPTVNDTTFGPPAWLTGRLREGGARSVRSPLRWTPLLASPIATPLQGGRLERPGLLFLKLLDPGRSRTPVRCFVAPCLMPFDANFRTPHYPISGFPSRTDERASSPGSSSSAKLWCDLAAGPTCRLSTHRAEVS